MLDKIKSYQDNPFIKSLGDVRNIGMIAFGVIALLVTWSSVKVVQTNYNLQKQMSAMQQVNDVQKMANENLKLRNQYLNTDAYLELAARRHFNKASPGETLMIVPKEVALAHSIEVPEPKTLFDTTAVTDEASGNKLQRNFNSWLDFLFHRQSE
jgi:cell division protein FtsB